MRIRRDRRPRERRQSGGGVPADSVARRVGLATGCSSGGDEANGTGMTHRRDGRPRHRSPPRGGGDLWPCSGSGRGAGGGARGADAAATVVRAPMDGVVLRVLQEDEGVVGAGSSLLELGDLTSMEVLTDVLSDDAARLRANAPASIAISTDTIRATVVRIEPKPCSRTPQARNFSAIRATTGRHGPYSRVKRSS